MVSLQPSATVTLRDLGLLDRLVACTKYCADVCPEVADGSRLIVSDSWTAQTEQILAARPDLVLASVPYQLEAVAAILKAGVRFLGLAPRRLADIYADMAAIAGVMGAWERGQSVITTMQNEIEAVRKRAVGCIQAKGLLRRMGKADHRVAAVGRANWWKLREASSSRRPARRSQRRKLHRRSPMSLWRPGAEQEIASRWRRSWSNAAGRSLPAVRQGRVFCINDELLNTPATSSAWRTARSGVGFAS